MLKLTHIFIILLLSNHAYALKVEVVGKNQEVLFSEIKEADLPSNLGKITVDVFDAHEVSYQGGEFGINTLFDLGSEMEVISDTEMKAYGWCFSINGEVPETMADETIVADQDSLIQWFYAYAHFKDGEWIKQCSKHGSN